MADNEEGEEVSKMADNEEGEEVSKVADTDEGEETSSRGNEWEVVSLTASTYAAAPGPKGFESNDDKGHEFIEDDQETSRAMFMSDHFVFPPSQHENLPPALDNSEIDCETRDVPVVSNEVPGSDREVGDKSVPRLDMEVGDKSDKKNDENWDMKGLTMPEELPGKQFSDEKGTRLSVQSAEFEEGAGLQGLNLVDEEHGIIYSAAKFSSFHAEANNSGSSVYDENIVLGEPCDQKSLNSPSDLSKSTNHNKKDEDLPHEAWWKRRAASLYTHAKEANTFWSIFVAAALMGLVIIGQRWQQEKLQVQQLKLQFNIKDEKMSRMLGPISRFKDVIVGGHRRGSTIGGIAEL